MWNLFLAPIYILFNYFQKPKGPPTGIYIPLDILKVSANILLLEGDNKSFFNLSMTCKDMYIYCSYIRKERIKEIEKRFKEYIKTEEGKRALMVIESLRKGEAFQIQV